MVTDERTQVYVNGALVRVEDVCDDEKCVSSGRAVLCDIHGEEYDRAHR